MQTLAPNPTTSDLLTTHLAEAEVVSLDGGITVALPGAGRLRAIPAFTVPYRPVIGDRLLVIGDAMRLYAIGVVAGAGQISLTVAGDMCVHAQGGRLTLSGDAGVEIAGPTVGIAAGTVEVIAERLTELLGEAMRRVRGLFTVEAGQASTFVEGHSSQHSQTAVITAAETVNVSGEQVHLG